MRNIVTIIVVVIITLLAAIVFFDLSFFRNSAAPIESEHLEKRDETQDLQSSERLIRQGQPEEAMEIIAYYIPEIEKETAIGNRWTPLLIKAGEESKDLAKLRALYEFNPAALDGYEKASLLIAEAYVNEGELESYRQIRDRWTGQENILHAWILLDSDKLLLEGRRGQANNLLATTTFTGKAEVDRLTRLALLNANENPKAAWRYLSSAQSKEPDNSEIRFYKGKLLESVGKNNYAAREYEAAATMDPSNLFLQDQLAEFYLRQGKHKKAMDIWVHNLESPTLDMIWVKALFWNRVLIPAKIDWKAHTPPGGKVAPLVQYMLELPAGTHWNKAQYSKLALRDYYLESQQATYWLRLLDALKQGREQEAATLLNDSPFATTSWNPELEYTLKQILTYRKKGRLDHRVSPIGLQLGSEGQSGSPLFAQIETYALNPDVEIPDDMHELFLSKEAFSAAFIAAGWYEAGLDLHQLHILPRHFPDWVAVELTKAYRRNRTDIDALDFASVQPQAPLLRLEIGEIYISGGDTNGALRILEPLTKEFSDTGARAALLTSLIYLERGELDEARDIVQKQPRLAHDVKGREILAKVSLMKGDDVKAEDLYESIKEKSLEAKTWLAQKAFKDQRWDRAKALTQELLKLYPNNKQLQQNLQRIVQEQQRTALVN